MLACPHAAYACKAKCGASQQLICIAEHQRTQLSPASRLNPESQSCQHARGHSNRAPDTAPAALFPPEQPQQLGQRRAPAASTRWRAAARPGSRSGSSWTAPGSPADRPRERPRRPGCRAPTARGPPAARPARPPSAHDSAGRSPPALDPAALRPQRNQLCSSSVSTYLNALHALHVCTCSGPSAPAISPWLSRYVAACTRPSSTAPQGNHLPAQPCSVSRSLDALDDW